MIVDQLENARDYHGLPEKLTAALDYLVSTDFSAAEAGRHEIRGEQIYAMVQRYRPRPKATALWEAHRRYFDVQFVVAGCEAMGYAPLPALEVDKPYDDENDAVLLKGAGSFIRAEAGTFFILGPQDAHMPGVEPDDSGADAAGEVTKVVVKVSVD